MIDVPGVGERGPRQLSRATLAEVIEPRVEELFQLIQQELRRTGFEDVLSSGIVLTGGAAKCQHGGTGGRSIPHAGPGGVPKYFGGLAEAVKDPRFPRRSACC